MLGHEKECFLGQPCNILGIGGISLRSGDRLMVLEDCGQGIPISGFPGFGIAEAKEPEGARFEFIAGASIQENESILFSDAGIFRLAIVVLKDRVCVRPPCILQLWWGCFF